MLQDNDGVKETAMTSAALWNSLKTSCLHMQRADLASLCDVRDLERESLATFAGLDMAGLNYRMDLVEFRMHFDEGG